MVKAQSWLRRHPWALGLSVPCTTLLVLLLCDAFNTRSLLSKQVISGEPLPLLEVKIEEQETRRPDVLGATVALDPGPGVASPTSSPPACQTDDLDKFRPAYGKYILSKKKEDKPLRSLLQPMSDPGGIPAAIADILAKPLKRKVGASIAVHPPKFYALANFLHDWIRCPAAFEALSLWVVFISQKDLILFREALQCISPGFPELWNPVVAQAPKHGWMRQAGSGNQYIAAYKKYAGIAAIMDRGEEEYGLMLDAEISIYDMHTKARTGTACGAGGPWSRLLDKIRALEAGQAFPAARVSSTLTTYNFGNFLKSGKDYDMFLIKENAQFVLKQANIQSCKSKGCRMVEEQIKNSLWSWWTDIPWLSLAVARRMMMHLSGRTEEVESIKDWGGLMSSFRFPRFEYLAYQQYCVMHEGFRFRDVTDVTMEAKWGSYLEDPQHGSRLAELNPMWASAETVERSEEKHILPLSVEAPPLLIFHTDHVDMRYTTAGKRYKELWEKLILDLLVRHKRTDWDSKTIK